MTVWIVCHKQYIQTVALLNDIACVLPGHCDCHNICHIPCTCTCRSEYSCVSSGRAEMTNFSHSEDNNTCYLPPDYWHEYSNIVCWLQLFAAEAGTCQWHHRQPLHNDTRHTTATALHVTTHYCYYYYSRLIELMGFWHEAATAGPYANNLHLTPDR